MMITMIRYIGVGCQGNQHDNILGRRSLWRITYINTWVLLGQIVIMTAYQEDIHAKVVSVTVFYALLHIPFLKMRGSLWSKRFPSLPAPFMLERLHCICCCPASELATIRYKNEKVSRKQCVNFYIGKLKKYHEFLSWLLYVMALDLRDPFYWHELISTLAWISNHVPW